MPLPDTLTRDSRPRLAAKTRLRFDRKAGTFMLLYPEKGLVLNATAADVAQLCTGEHTVGAIVERLAANYNQEPAIVEREVLALLNSLAERGLIQDSP